MLTRLKVTSPPAQPPVSLDLVRRHLRVLQSSDDDLINLYIASATAQAEAYLNRTLISTSYTWVMADTFPPSMDALAATPLVIVPLAISFNGFGAWNRWIEIPRGPVSAVSSVVMGQWHDVDVPQTLGTDYDLDLLNDPPRIRINTPSTTDIYDHMAVSYTAGYDVVPVSVVHAILIFIAAMFERRGDDEATIPTAFWRLLDQHRLVHFAS